MINVGFTNINSHGITKEIRDNPPEGIFLKNIECRPDHIFSRGIFYIPKAEGIDIIESFDDPCITPYKHLQHLSSIQSTISLFNLDLSRSTRLEIWKELSLKENCKKIIFMSNAGYDTLKTYGNIKDKEIYEKSEIVYPAFRPRNIKNRQKLSTINILFSGGNFYQKGGEFLIYAFDEISKKYDIKLKIFSNLLNKNYLQNTKYHPLNHKEVLSKIFNNPKIESNPIIDRDKLLNIHYPESDIVLFHSMQESFGFTPVEAMSYGKPILGTNIGAVPEIVEHGKEGILIDIKDYDLIKNPNKYLNSNNIYTIPKKFRESMINEIKEKLTQLIENDGLRRRLGNNGIKKHQNKFSFEKRNKIMKRIYKECL